MVGRPQKRTQETRKRILSAARHLFDAQGFDETSVDEIAVKAEVAKGTVFAHFTDKTSLLIAVKIEQLDKLVGNMQSMVQVVQGDDPVEFLVAMFRPWLKLFRGNRDFTELFLIQGGLKQGPWTSQFIDVCVAMGDNIELALAALVTSGHMAEKTDIKLYSQGVQALFYHVVVGYSTGVFKDGHEQEELLVGMLEKWVKQG